MEHQHSLEASGRYNILFCHLADLPPASSQCMKLNLLHLLQTTSRSL